MSAGKLRCGLIGFGSVGRLHERAYRIARNVEVVAVADVALSALEELSGKYRVYSDAKMMLHSENLDIACVLTPASNHFEVVNWCASAGVNILCEKPIALSVGDAELMVATTRDAGVRLAYGASYRFLPAVLTAHELIASGAIGRIRLMREQAIGGHGLSKMQVMPTSHYPDGGPGGFAMGLADHGIHLIDLFDWFVGQPAEQVSGRMNRSGKEALPEALLLEYASGALGQLVYDEGTFATELPSEGMFSEGEGWDVDGFVEANSWTSYPGYIGIHGTLGSLRIFHYANRVFLRDAQGIREIPVSGRPSPYHFTAQIECFADDILLQRDTSVPGELGVKALRTLMKIA